MNRLKVLHVLDHSLPHRSGYAMRSSSILKFQRLSGCDPVVLTSPRHGDSERPSDVIDGIACHRSDSVAVAGDKAGSRIPFLREKRQMRYMERRIMEVASAEQAQVIHAHSPSLNGIPAVRAARRLGLPVVYEVRAFWEDAAVDQRKIAYGSLKYRLSRFVETRLFQQVDHVTTICQGIREELISRGVAPDRLTVIPNGVAPQDFDSAGATDAVIRRYGLEDKRVLGFIGSFYRYEGLQLLIRAMKTISVYRPDVRLVLVGSGEMEAELAAQVRALGLEHIVLLPGSRPPNEVRDFYAAMDVLVYPRLPERITNIVTPLKPLEAMAMGKIVVGSDVGGIAEMVQDGQTGFLFEAGSCDDLIFTLLKTLSETERWPAIATQAQDYVRLRRNWSDIVPRYLDVYDRAIHRSKQTNQLAAPVVRQVH
jgi:PEP-CTERM/exosortase A-associated glycosyltransferase